MNEISDLCTYRLNWARGTCWGWWYEWDDTVLQIQDSKLKPRRSEAECATSRSWRLPTKLIVYEWAGKKLLFLETWIPKRGGGADPRSPTFQTGSFNQGPVLLPVYNVVEYKHIKWSRPWIFNKIMTMHTIWSRMYKSIWQQLWLFV